MLDDAARLAGIPDMMRNGPSFTMTDGGLGMNRIRPEWERAMYSSIAIRNLRGIESLDASGFRRINLIMGRNDSGKTTFLEGFYVLARAHGHKNAVRRLSPSGDRGMTAPA